MTRSIPVACILAAMMLAGCGRRAEDGNAEPVAESPAPNPATVPTARTGRWVEWHRRCVDRAAKGNVDVLFLGDSIIDMWRSRGRDPWKKHFKPLGAANFGISADRTEHVLWRLQHGALKGISPKLVVLLIGTNNLKSGPVRQPPGEVVEGVRAVIDEIQAREPDAKILLLAILPRQPKYAWIDEAIAETNRRLAQVAAEDPRIRYLDTGHVFRGPDGGINAETMSEDNLHPSEEGYRRWAKALVGPVREMLRNGTE